MSSDAGSDEARPDKGNPIKQRVSLAGALRLYSEQYAGHLSFLDYLSAVSALLKKSDGELDLDVPYGSTPADEQRVDKRALEEVLGQYLRGEIPLPEGFDARVEKAVKGGFEEVKDYMNRTFPEYDPEAEKTAAEAGRNALVEKVREAVKADRKSEMEDFEQRVEGMIGEIKKGCVTHDQINNFGEKIGKLRKDILGDLRDVKDGLKDVTERTSSLDELFGEIKGVRTDIQNFRDKVVTKKESEVDRPSCPITYTLNANHVGELRRKGLMDDLSAHEGISVRLNKDGSGSMDVSSEKAQSYVSGVFERVWPGGDRRFS